MTHPQGYEPYSDIRRVDMRIRLLSNYEITLRDIRDKGSITYSAGWESFNFKKLLKNDPGGVAAVAGAGGTATASISLVDAKSGIKPYFKVIFSEESQLGDDAQVSVSFTTTDGSGMPINGYPVTVDVSNSCAEVTQSEVMELYGGSESNAVTEATRFRLIQFTVPAGSVIVGIELIENMSEGLVFDSDSIVSAELKEETTLCGESFPARKLTAVMDNADKLFDLNIPGKYSGRVVSAEIGINGMYIDLGSFYIDALEEQNGGLEAKLTMYDRTKYLEDYRSWLGSTGEPRSIGEYESLGQGPFGGSVFDISTNVRNTYIEPDMSMDSVRSLLKKVAEAAVAAIWSDRSDVIHMVDGIPDSDTVHLLTADCIEEYTFEDNGGMDMVVFKGTNCAAESGAYDVGGKSKVVQNSFVSGISAKYASDLYLVTADESRVFAKIKYRGDPCIEVGDKVVLKNRQGEIAMIGPVLSSSLSYDGGLAGSLSICSGLEFSDISSMT